MKSSERFQKIRKEDPQKYGTRTHTDQHKSGTQYAKMVGAVRLKKESYN